MRLPPAVVVHRDRYDDSGLEAEVEAYDRRRHARKPIPPEKQRHTDKYGALDFCGWSANVTRQLSPPERATFMSFLRRHGSQFASQALCGCPGGDGWAQAQAERDGAEDKGARNSDVEGKRV